VDAEEFLQSLYPNLFFLQVTPENVIERENATDKFVQFEIPIIADMGLLKDIGIRHVKPFWTPFTMKGLFLSVKNSKNKLLCDFRELKVNVSNNLIIKRKRFLENTEEHMELEQDFSAKRPNSAKIIYEQLLLSIYQNSAKIKESDVSDIIHTTVPLAYCDFLFLDGSWKAKANALKRKLRKNNCFVNVATVFSGKKSDWPPIEFFKLLLLTDGK
jgi:hypothetical protein